MFGVCREDAYRLCVRVANKDIVLLRKGENQERERDISKGEG